MIRIQDRRRQPPPVKEPVDLLPRNAGAISSILSDMEQRMVDAIRQRTHGKIVFEVNLTADQGVHSYLPLTGEGMRFA